MYYITAKQYRTLMKAASSKIASDNIIYFQNHRAYVYTDYGFMSVSAQCWTTDEFALVLPVPWQSVTPDPGTNVAFTTDQMRIVADGVRHQVPCSMVDTSMPTTPNSLGIVKNPDFCEYGPEFVEDYKTVASFAALVSGRTSYVAFSPSTMTATDSRIMIFRDGDYSELYKQWCNLAAKQDVPRLLQLFIPHNIPFIKGGVKVSLTTYRTEPYVVFTQYETQVGMLQQTELAFYARTLDTSLKLPEWFDDKPTRVFSLTQDEFQSIWRLIPQRDCDIAFTEIDGQLGIGVQPRFMQNEYSKSFVTNIPVQGTFNVFSDVMYVKKLLRLHCPMDFSLLYPPGSEPVPVFSISTDKYRVILMLGPGRDAKPGDFQVTQTIRAPGIGKLLADSQDVAEENKSKLNKF